MVASELLALALFLVVGWVALWPFRARLGAASYHLAAVPVGLLASPLALVFSSVSERPLDAVSVTAGALLLAAVLWAIGAFVLDRAGTAEPVAPVSYAVAGCSALVAGVVFGVLRFSASNYDSMEAYWPLGVRLTRDGAYTVFVASSRSALIPSMNAVHALLGSDWAYVIYPVLGVLLAAWLGVTVWNRPLSGVDLQPRRKWVVVTAVVAFLCLEPSFVFNMFMVHSQMISAVYLLVALTSIWAAVPPTGGGVDRAFLVLAGASTAGLALSRPDGLAYQFVPVVAAISALTVSEVRLRDVAAYFAPPIVLESAVYGAAFARLGMWQASKLDGSAVLAILVVLAGSAAMPWIVAALDDRTSRRVRGERFFGMLVAASAAMMLVAFIAKWGSARRALAHAGINLFLGAGGYFYLWWAVALFLVLTVLSGDALRARSWTRPAFLGVILFFIIAGLVHGLSHEGRIGAGDSFNRVAFEILPVVIWLAGATAARILGPETHARA